MAKSAVTELTAHVETIRREAYNEGYAAAMRAVVEFTTGTPKSKATTAKAIAQLHAAPPQARTKPTVRRAVRQKTTRGDNARHIAEAMSVLPDRTGPAAAIRRALADKGVDMPYTSIRHGLGQLQARGEASVAADGRTWTYSGVAQ